MNDTNLLENIEQRLARLSREAAALRAENRYLRKLTSNGQGGRILRRVHADALTLLLWRYSGLTISKRECAKLGMSEHRWSWSIALLRYARIYTDGDLIAPDLDTARRHLDAAVERIKSQDDDKLIALRARGAKRLRYRRRR